MTDDSARAAGWTPESEGLWDQAHPSIEIISMLTI